MNKDVIIAAQIRAGRALLEWSQERLAKEAQVGISSVRDIESQKRAAETGAVNAIRQALENGGVEFVSGTKETGPGVRLIANRPNIIRRPTTMTAFEGLPFFVEWQGKEVTVFVSREVLDDLGELAGQEPDSIYLEVFEKNRGAILDGVTRAIVNPENFDRSGRLYVRGKDILGLAA